MVLVKVLVAALCTVEGVHCFPRRWGGGLHLFIRGVFVRVRDFGGLAELVYTGPEPGADEEGGYGGEEDIAVVELADSGWLGGRWG
jgi:hypothetical protein